MKAFSRNEQKISIGAHRGASRYCPENTMSAFRKALEFGVDRIECDIQLSKDGQPVVFHDFSLDRTTDGSGLLSEHTLSELKALNAGQWFSKESGSATIPTLEEVLSEFKDEIALSLELKEMASRQSSIAKQVVDLIASYKMEDQVLFMSFNHPLLYEVRKLSNDSVTQVICGARLVKPIRYLRDLNAQGINMPPHFLSESIVEGIHKAGFHVSGSLVDDPAILEKYLEWGVEMFDTNVPQLMLNARDRNTIS